MTTETLNAVKEILKTSKKSSIKTPLPNRVMTALTDWIETYPFDPDPEFVPRKNSDSIEFNQTLLQNNLQFYFATSQHDSVLALMIHIDGNEIPREKQSIIRDWMTWRNISLNVGCFQMTPDSKNFYYFGSIDFSGVQKIDARMISNLYNRGRISVGTYIGEFINLTKLS
jgi:hypothetical protein